VRAASVPRAEFASERARYATQERPAVSWLTLEPIWQYTAQAPGGPWEINYACQILRYSGHIAYAIDGASTAKPTVALLLPFRLDRGLRTMVGAVVCRWLNDTA